MTALPCHSPISLLLTTFYFILVLRYNVLCWSSLSSRKEPGVVQTNPEHAKSPLPMIGLEVDM